MLWQLVLWENVKNIYSDGNSKHIYVQIVCNWQTLILSQHLYSSKKFYCAEVQSSGASLESAVGCQKI